MKRFLLFSLCLLMNVMIQNSHSMNSEQNNNNATHKLSKPKRTYQQKLEKVMLYEFYRLHLEEKVLPSAKEESPFNFCTLCIEKNDSFEMSILKNKICSKLPVQMKLNIKNILGKFSDHKKVQECIKLESLKLISDDLTTLPMGIYQLTSLKRLYLKESNLREISSELINLPYLQIIKVAENCKVPSNLSSLVWQGNQKQQNNVTESQPCCASIPNTTTQGMQHDDYFDEQLVQEVIQISLADNNNDLQKENKKLQSKLDEVMKELKEMKESNAALTNYNDALEKLLK